MEHIVAELREDLRDLAEEVIAVAAGEGAQVLAIPPWPAVFAGRRAGGQRRHLGGEPGIQEERERQPAVAAEVAHPVRRGPVPAPGHAVQHVADVADERAGDWRRVDPAFRRGDLEAPAVVLGEQGKQPVVGVLAHSPARVPRRRGRVVEDAEQHGRIRGVSRGEVPGVEPQAQRDLGQHRLTEAGELVQVRQHQGAQPGNLPREQVAAVQRQACHHARVVAGQFGAEIQSLLQVGLSRGEFGAHRKVATPGPPAAGHLDLQLVRQRQGEEFRARLGQLAEQVRGHAMPGHVEEAAIATRRLDPFGRTAR
ncbi:MAG TPA: hypothetical protein VFB06_18580 [Streptosporangiaceae bacterium]|nr:hypothetical protein [Streptosporangiaceae bacterium]